MKCSGGVFGCFLTSLFEVKMNSCSCQDTSPKDSCSLLRWGWGHARTFTSLSWVFGTTSVLTASLLLSSLPFVSHLPSILISFSIHLYLLPLPSTSDTFITSCPLFTQFCSLTIFWLREHYSPTWAKPLKSCLNTKQSWNVWCAGFLYAGKWPKEIREVSWKRSSPFHCLCLSKHARHDPS